jgi:diaminopimelate decarboxylase
MENGRFITGPCGWLVSRCNAVKTAFGTRFYGLDACMANLMRPGMYNSYHHITVPTSSQAVEPCNVVGTLCENNDWFASQRPLPRAAKGDLFVIHDTGAHSHSMGFQYNSKLRAPEVLLETGKAPRLIRTRETNADLFANAMEFVAGGGGGAGLPLASSLPKTSSPPAAAVRMTLCGLVGLVLLAGAAKWR